MEMQHNKAIIALTVLFPCLFILIPFYFLLYVCNKYIQMSPNILSVIISCISTFVKGHNFMLWLCVFLQAFA